MSELGEPRLNPEWIRVVAKLVDDAHDTVGRHLVDPARDAASLEASFRPGGRGVEVIEGFRANASTAPLAEIWQIAVMAANRFTVTAMCHLDGFCTALTALSAVDSHAAAAPLARAALEHLGAAGWILDPSVDPPTTIARYIVLLKASAAEAAGLRVGSQPASDWIKSFGDKQALVLERAGYTLRESEHGVALRATYVDRIDRTLRLGAELGIEAPQHDTGAEGLYGLLSAWSHPNFVEQVLRDRRIAVADETMYYPRPNPELSRLAAVSTARLLRIVVELLLRIAGAEDYWSDRAVDKIRRL